MRRLARHLFTLCSAASLVLCIAVCVLWVRSYWSATTVSYTRFAFDGDDDDGPASARRIMYVAASMSGHLVVERSEVPMTFDDPARAREYVAAPGRLAVYGQHDFLRGYPRLTYANRLGFFYMDDPGSRGKLSRYVVPTWAVALPLLATAAWILARHVRRRTVERRLRNKQCPACGYDLRASPGRCPECGTAS